MVATPRFCLRNTGSELMQDTRDTWRMAASIQMDEKLQQFHGTGLPTG